MSIGITTENPDAPAADAAEKFPLHDSCCMRVPMELAFWLKVTAIGVWAFVFAWIWHLRREMPREAK